MIHRILRLHSFLRTLTHTIDSWRQNPAVLAGLSVLLVNALLPIAVGSSTAGYLAGALAGAVASVLITLGLKQCMEESAAESAARRANVVRLVNHHVRNALQPLYWNELTEAQMAKVREASTRIDWVLREVLESERVDQPYVAASHRSVAARHGAIQ